MSTLTSLPSELLARIAAHADRSTLKAMRETCRRLSHCCLPFLFRTLHLFPDEKSYNALDGILGDDRLKNKVKDVYVNTCEEDYDSYDEAEDEFSEEFETAIERLEGFQNVQSATLRFDKHCAGNGEDWMEEHPQTISYRTQVLGTFFAWLDSLEVPLRALGIRNLQDINPKEPDLVKEITKILQNLRSLRLSIVTEHHSPSPEVDLELEDPHTFFAELPSTWLKPTTATLEHLVLNCDNYFGFYPKLDLSQVHFPRLKTLALGNYGFAQDSQLEWILSHSPTLTELYLDDCAILYDVCIFSQNLPRCPFDRHEMEDRGEPNGPLFDPLYYRSYDKRWHDYFDAFRIRLPLLSHFRMGSSGWQDGVPFDREDRIYIGLLHERYLACYDGTGPSPYTSQGREGPNSVEKNPPTCDLEDVNALRALLSSIGQKVEEDWKSGYHEVRGLLDVKRSWCG